MKNLALRMLPVQIVPPRQDTLDVRCSACHATVSSGSVIVVGIVDGKLSGFLFAEYENRCCPEARPTGAKLFQNLFEADEYVGMLHKTKADFNLHIVYDLAELEDILAAVNLSLKDLDEPVKNSIKKECESN